VAIVIALQHEATPALSRFNYDAMPSSKSRIIAFCCWYITLRCDLDIWPWTFAAYRLWTKLERSRVRECENRLFIVRNCWICTRLNTVAYL